MHDLQPSLASTSPLRQCICRNFFSFYCIPVTIIKDADDTPLSHGERVSDVRIIFLQSERTSDTETSQSLSDEAHTVNFPSITWQVGPLAFAVG